MYILKLINCRANFVVVELSEFESKHFHFLNDENVLARGLTTSISKEKKEFSIKKGDKYVFVVLFAASYSSSTFHRYIGSSKMRTYVLFSNT